MRPNKLILWFAAAVLVLALLPAQVHAALRAGQPAPNFKAITTSGQPVSMDNYRGYVLVIDFFATWCPPCNESIPHLIDINRKYGKQGLQILGLSMDEDGEQIVKSFIDERRINYPVALASEQVQIDYGIVSVPVMFVIDKKGKVSEIYRGYSDETGRSMEALIKKLLAEK
ncbi:MAG: TlpA family protein disulfide reductase [Geobacter sp.]|nr:MAG: TlpA family protein disulfide reductase [Geobacter sp.]